MAYLERYKNWVRLHAGKLSLLEGTVDALTWLLPDRFSDSEFALEAINSALGLISVLNGYLIAQDGVRSEESGRSRRLMWPILLGALQNVDILIELGADSLEEKRGINKFIPIMGLEAIKALLRILVLHAAAGRILMEGGVSENGSLKTLAVCPEHPTARTDAIYCAFQHFRGRYCTPPTAFFSGHGRESESSSSEDLSGLEESCSFSASGSSAEYTSASSSDVGDSSATASALALTYAQLLEVSRATSAAGRRRRGQASDVLAFGELLFLLRPLLYASALRRKSARSWAPWLLSLVLQLSSNGAILAAARLDMPKPAAVKAALGTSTHALLERLKSIRWAPEERAELGRRRALLAFCLVQSPFFEKYTKRAIDPVLDRVVRIPLVGDLAARGRDILLGAQEYYTYTVG